jgi:hypothetical protein
MTATVNNPGVHGRAWAAAQALANALRARLTTPVTGRRWRRPPRECPPWCAADHRCTARLGYPSGEHRSEPITWRTPYGLLIATRVETIQGTGHLDLRATVRLPDNDEAARGQAQLLPVGIDLTIRAITGQPILPTAPNTTGGTVPTAACISASGSRALPALVGVPLPIGKVA